MENQIIATSATVIEQVEQLARRPIPLTGADTALLYAVPDGYSVKDMSNLLEAPARKSGATAMHDVDSFITMVKRHGSLAECLIYIDADYVAQRVNAVAVFNDHGDDPLSTGWRDHRATFTPRLTEEWKRWAQRAGKKNAMTQTEFGFFLEENLGDINKPDGGEVLSFVTTLTETRKVKYGSAVNLTNGMMQLEYTEEGDAATKGKLDMFREFTLGIRPFMGSSAYSL